MHSVSPSAFPSTCFTCFLNLSIKKPGKHRKFNPIQFRIWMETWLLAPFLFLHYQYLFPGPLLSCLSLHLLHFKRVHPSPAHKQVMVPYTELEDLHKRNKTKNGWCLRWYVEQVRTSQNSNPPATSNMFLHLHCEKQTIMMVCRLLKWLVEKQYLPGTDKTTQLNSPTCWLLAVKSWT